MTTPLSVLLPQPDLAMVGLGLRDDQPPHELQPPLKSGIHLRWAFVHRPGRKIGFPWFGYTLFRRPHPEPKEKCLSQEELAQQEEPPWPSDPPEVRRRFNLGPQAPAFSVRLQALVRVDAELAVIALAGSQPAERQVMRVRQGDQVSLEFNAFGVTAIGLSVAEVEQLKICFAPLAWRYRGGWEQISGFPYPLALPVIHPDYPLTANQPPDLAASEQMALGRISYGPTARWQGQPFHDLHDQLIHLVEGGPARPMTDPGRAQPFDLTAAQDPSTAPPNLAPVHPLDLVLLAALHPAMAQMLGLYWLDTSVDPNAAVDYLILADYEGKFARAFDHNPLGAIADALNNITTGVDWYILDNGAIDREPKLPPPTEPRVYVLPGGPVGGRDGGTIMATNNAGLRWELGLSLLGKLSAWRPVAYHVWRSSNLGMVEPAALSPEADFAPLAPDLPVTVAPPSVAGQVARPPGWPPYPLFAIDRGLADGWYSYAISGVDIFGRHSAPSAAAAWYEWQPELKPGANIYSTLAGETLRHPFAVFLIDRVPPPAPVGVEAYLLDPADPWVVADAAYQSWRAANPGVVGLRVRWTWTEGQMQQAPDTAEFRLYFNPGQDPPPGAEQAANWQKRLHVNGFAANATAGVDNRGRPLRRYEVFLPAPDALVASLANPIVYAHIGASAADDKIYAADDPKWAGTPWGGRSGNEGAVSSPAKVFRVHRDIPQPPVPPPDSEKVFATPADYHSRSFYTFRWAAQPFLKAHIARAMDESVFAAEAAQPARPFLDPLHNSQHAAWFPATADDPAWTDLRRQRVADELNGLNSLRGDRSRMLAALRQLGNDALRVLAGLPGNERAFMQLTVAPLDPADPLQADRRGPDSPADYAPQPQLRAYTDTLDGRSTNRYFYRAAYVDGAHNRSPLSLSSPPVWLPNVVPPAVPVLTGILAGERQVTLRWASNREPDLAAYRVYRADSADLARDLRLMAVVQTLAVPPGEPEARPAEVSWTDTPLPGLVTFYYRLVAVDDAGNVSPPSQPAPGRAFDTALPQPPPLAVAWTGDDPPSARAAWTAAEETQLERRPALGAIWEAVTDWLGPGSHIIDDPVEPTLPWYYRLRVRKATGALAIGPRANLPSHGG